MAIRTRTHTQTGIGVTEAVDVVDSNQMAVAYQINITGSVTATLEHSLDGLNWFANADATAIQASADGNYILPVRAIRLNVTAGDGDATLIVRQLVV